MNMVNFLYTSIGPGFYYYKNSYVTLHSLHTDYIIGFTTNHSAVSSTAIITTGRVSAHVAVGTMNGYLQT